MPYRISTTPLTSIPVSAGRTYETRSGIRVTLEVDPSSPSFLLASGLALPYNSKGRLVGNRKALCPYDLVAEVAPEEGLGELEE